MTGHLLDVDPSGLRRARSSLAQLSSSVEQALRRLDAKLAAEGACWGSDEVGIAFGRGYLPAAGQTCEAGAALRDGVGDLGERLAEVAHWAEMADADAQSRLRREV